MLNNDELGKAYGLGYYSRNNHDIIADTYLMGRETFYYRADPSMTRGDAFKCHLRKVRHKVRSDYRKRKGKEVYVDDIGELAAPQDECYSDEVTPRGFSGQHEYPLRAENILNRLLLAQVKTFVDTLLAGHEKKTRQMLLKYYGEKLTYEQVAKKFSCSKSTAERKIKKAKSQINAIVRRKGLEYQDFTRFKPQSIYRKPHWELIAESVPEEMDCKENYN
ncbi:MAG: RNA polymerase sigma factor [Dissulfurispiraceae bacterium]